MKRNRSGVWKALGLLVLLCASFSHTSTWAGLPEELKGKLGDHDSLLLCSPDGAVLCSWNPDTRRTPASTLKVLTSLVALETMGPSHRFVTDFFTDEEGNLKVKGYGDPLLLSEVIQTMAAAVARIGGRFRALVLDDSYFARTVVVPGTGQTSNPYDAPVGALSANFNTVAFRYDSRGKMVSAEPQTPLVSLAEEILRKRGVAPGRVVLSGERSETTLYAGHLLHHFLVERDVMAEDTVLLGRVNPADRFVYRHESPFSLRAVVERLLAHSNNFIANQVLLAMGAARHGPPATLEKGVQVVEAYARNELALGGLTVVEGSGISRQNRLSAREMMKILCRFAPYSGLMREEKDMVYKSGTLKGVDTRAGYFRTRTQGLFAFVIFLNSDRGSARGIAQALQRMVSGSR